VEEPGAFRRAEPLVAVEVLSTCPTNWGLTPLEAVGWLKGNMVPYFPLGVYADRAEVK
jgi:2-oxoglutarate ferredoxin oxidoreductase subunit beta